MNSELGFEAEGLVGKIADKLVRAIASGRVEPGNALPTPKELAAETDISAPMVREAIAVLRSHGAIEVSSGVATRAANIIQRGSLALVLPLLIHGPEDQAQSLFSDLLNWRARLLVDAWQEISTFTEPDLFFVNDAINLLEKAESNGWGIADLLCKEEELWMTWAKTAGSPLRRMLFQATHRTLFGLLRATTEVTWKPCSADHRKVSALIDQRADLPDQQLGDLARRRDPIWTDFFRRARANAEAQADDPVGVIELKPN